MIEIFRLTIDSIRKGKLAKYIFISIFLALTAIVLFVLGITTLSAFAIQIETTWLKNTLVALVGILSTVGGWFMLPPINIIISGIFQENIINTTEHEYYPERVRKKGPSFFADIPHDIKFAALSLAINIIMLPFYFFAIGIFIAIAVNTYLMGREFFENVAGYHIGKDNARQLGKKKKSIVFINGLIITLASLVPILNFLVPVVATVWMTHVYHKKLVDKNDGDVVVITSDSNE